MAVEVKIKKWGNSMGVILPKGIIEEKGLEENDTIFVEIVREADLSDAFGMIKKRRMSGQKAKDLMRQGWKS